MNDIGPEAAAQMATGEVEPTALPPVDDTTENFDQKSGASIIDGLLETEPPGSINTYPDIPDWTAHTLIGVQKFINGIAKDHDLKGGKPAIIDFTQAVISFVSDSSGSQTDEPAENNIPAGAIGGDIDE